MFKPYGEKINPLDAQEPQWKKSLDLQKEESSLRDLVDRNFSQNSKVMKKPRKDLVDNFHWVIMRTRRGKKITQEQFAKAILEPLAAVKMAEQGVLPEKDYILVRKIERFLGISIVKEEEMVIPEVVEKTEMSSEELRFKANEAKNLTIADLKNMKKTGDFEYPDMDEK